MRKLGIIVLALSLALLSACSKPADTGTTTPTTKAPETTSPTASLTLKGDVDSSKTLTTLVNIEPPPAFHGNPTDDVAGLNWSVQPFLFDALADYSPLPEKTFKPVALASYKAEGNKLTLVLKDGLKWSDGSALTMDDVETGLYIASRAGTLWQVMDKMERTDAKTITITFVNDSPLNLPLVLNSYIMTPKAKYGQFADEYKAYVQKYRIFDDKAKRYKFDPAGDQTLKDLNTKLNAYKPDPLKDVLYSGPYVLTGVTSSEAIFEVNKNYRTPPAVTKIRGLRSAGAEVFSTAVLQNQYTVENGGLSPELTKQVEGKFKDTLRTIYVPEFSQIGYMFNTTKPPFNIPEVRKAFAYMMDRETLIKLAEPGSFISDTHASGLLPSMAPAFTSQGFMDKLTDYKYDPKKAEELLTKIGWKKVNGKWANEKGEVVKFELATIGSWPSLMYPGEAYAAMLKDAGFDIEFKPMEFAAFVAYLKAGSHQIAGYFLPGMSGYQHPWEVFNNSFNGSYATYMGLAALPSGTDRVVKDPVDSKEYNVTQMLSQLYAATDKTQVVSLTEQFATLNNHLVNFVPLIEKTTPFRIYDTKLSLAEGTIGKPQNSFYYYGNLNNILLKMLRDNKLFFVK
jgi:peptide/nickel transport system substrate-binding protein